jgi:phosphoglycerol transferase MdoB-like AlkP superfamily enzyme
MSNPISNILHRHRALAIVCAVALFVFSVTRIVLLAVHWEDIENLTAIPLVFLAGVFFDLLACAVIALLPAIIAVFVSAKGISRRWSGFLVIGFSSLAIFGMLYLAVTEYFFFEEFTARLNYVAVDYLIFHHEVFVNIRETYPVNTIIAICAVAAIVIMLLVGRGIREGLKVPSKWYQRLVFAGALTLGVVLTFRVMHRDTVHVTSDRLLNEIAGNGICSFINAALSNELSYDDYYLCIDDSEALSRLRRQLTTPSAKFADTFLTSWHTRVIASEHPQRKLNVVLVLEESFGSDFVGALRPDGKNCTPQFDALASKGTLFTHVYATGNRTVRGIEASLVSFPPIPGQSIVRRPLGVDMFSLPSLLASFGYQTVFLYGGLGYFDNIEHFASRNGYQDVIDQTDFAKNTFSTIWGVCDEDLFDNSLATCDSLAATGKPFFATILTVSNHSPFLYPEGRIPFDPKKQSREYAVRYADYAIGKFIRDAESHSFFDSTLFIFLGDHGARVYGSQQIPLRSYEIPILFYGPGVVDSGKRVDRLGSQMDLAPTIVDVLGLSYESQFFGRSLLRSDTGGNWALMSHNRDVSLLRNDTLVVLGIQNGIDVYHVDLMSGAQTRLDVGDNAEIIHDAIAWYQTAFSMYSQQAFRPPKRQ